MDQTYLSLRRLLMGGLISGATLETLLNTSGEYLAAWIAMTGHRSSMRMIGRSHNALTAIAASAKALAIMSASVPAMNAMNDVGTIQRTVFTVSGTWTAPALGYYAAVALCVGGGATGAGSSGSTGGYCGGGGGEVKAALIPLALTSVTVTVATAVAGITNGGAAGLSSSFGAHVVSAGGLATSSNLVTAPAAAGSASSGKCYWPALESAPWQSPFNAQGGRGQHGGLSPRVRGPNCTDEFGTVIGLGGYDAATSGPGAPGNMYSGGGQGGRNSSAHGQDAPVTSYGAGGGGCTTSGSAAGGGNGAPGLVVVYVLRRLQ